MNEKLPFEINIPIFHHSIIPCARQKLGPRKNSSILNKLYKFRDVMEGLTNIFMDSRTGLPRRPSPAGCPFFLLQLDLVCNR